MFWSIFEILLCVGVSVYLDLSIFILGVTSDVQVPYLDTLGVNLELNIFLAFEDWTGVVLSWAIAMRSYGCSSATIFLGVCKLSTGRSKVSYFNSAVLLSTYSSFTDCAGVICFLIPSKHL